MNKTHWMRFTDFGWALSDLVDGAEPVRSPGIGSTERSWRPKGFPKERPTWSMPRGMVGRAGCPCGDNCPGSSVRRSAKSGGVRWCGWIGAWWAVGFMVVLSRVRWSATRFVDSDEKQV